MIDPKKLTPIWLVWESRNGTDQIRAIDTTEERAEQHKKCLTNSFNPDAKVWVEKTVLDHLFGWACLEMMNGRGQSCYSFDSKESKT
jgi:hypothetical protein